MMSDQGRLLSWGSNQPIRPMMMSRYSYLPEVLLIVAGLVMRIWFALLPIDVLLALLEDDAWMVAAIARNWAVGLGMTADGVNPTNGFHPLYPLTIGAIPYLFFPNDPDAGFRMGMITCALLSSLATVLLYGLLRVFANRPIAIIGLALFALNPLLTHLSVNVMETSLALVLLLRFWWYGLAYQPTSILGMMLLGMLGAFASLARLDFFIAFVILGGMLLWSELRKGVFPRRTTIYLLAAAPLLVPYFVRNVLMFDNVFPSSGRAISYMHSYADSFVLSSGLQIIAYQPIISMTWAPNWLLLLSIFLFAWLCWSLAPYQRLLLTPLVLYALAITFYYSYLLQQGSPRYYVGVGVVVVTLLSARMSLAYERARDTRWEKYPAVLAGAIAVSIMTLNSIAFWNYTQTMTNAPYLVQPTMHEAALWISEKMPKDVQLAAKNSGIFQYYSDRPVLNIDGKLNHEIIPYLERRQLDIYLRYRGVTHIVDVEGVGDYIELYSSSMSEAPFHPEMSHLDKLRTYGQLIAARLGLGEEVHLNEAVPTRIIRPFDTMVTEVKRFPLPNDPDRAIVIYELGDEFGIR